MPRTNAEPARRRRSGAMRAAALALCAGGLSPAGPSAAGLHAAPLPIKADLSAIGADGRRVTLASPARRIVALSPGLVELTYSAGAGEKLVGRSSRADFPAAAAALPEVAAPGRVDHERLVALGPDLVLAWGSGNPARALERLRHRGMPVYVAEPGRLADLAVIVRAIGHLAGTAPIAEAAAADFERKLAASTATPADRPRVYVELWANPPLTVNDRHLIADIVRHCGGDNLFGMLTALTPRIGIEDVIAARPSVVLSSAGPTALAWADRWPGVQRLVPAMQRDRVLNVDPEKLHLQSFRVLEAVTAACHALRAH